MAMRRMPILLALFWAALLLSCNASPSRLLRGSSAQTSAETSEFRTGPAGESQGCDSEGGMILPPSEPVPIVQKTESHWIAELGPLALHVEVGASLVRNQTSRFSSSKVTLFLHGDAVLASPAQTWSIGRHLKEGWPSTWDVGTVERVDIEGRWIVLQGNVSTADGNWVVQDRWRIYDGVVEGMRSWRWMGVKAAEASTLSISWEAPDASGRGLVLPGVLYHGNPAGESNMKQHGESEGLVPVWNGKSGERLQVEEHRLAQTWASFEWQVSSRIRSKRVVVALDSVPSSLPFADNDDLHWSLGAAASNTSVTLQLLSGPVALNGRTGMVKTGQTIQTPFQDVGIKVAPGGVVQKFYRLHASLVDQEGAGFRVPLNWSILHGDLSAQGLPRFPDIVDGKVRFALSRWKSDNKYPGFAMYPYPGNGDLYVMGWAGQAEAPGYALQVLADRFEDQKLREVAESALDVLSQTEFNDDGFLLALNGRTGEWTQQDPISQGQAMSAFARAIRYVRGRGENAKATKWETFLKKACEIHSARILASSWHPRSTAEAFLVQPLAIASGLFQDSKNDFLAAALKAGEHYRQRHLSMSEPFWGGTLDASCEDKEGAWAGFEAFLSLYEATGEDRWLEAANYAADFTLTYTYLWDVPLPPGRLRDHGLKTRGWTAVSVQNMHLDVYGVLYAPRLWRLGKLSKRPELMKLAVLMYRTCGQMMDALGSQGEQLQQTRFAQAGDLSNPDRFRGGYVESWTVFWIGAHFLTAAAQFEEMGVLVDLWHQA